MKIREFDELEYCKKYQKEFQVEFDYTKKGLLLKKEKRPYMKSA